MKKDIPFILSVVLILLMCTLLTACDDSYSNSVKKEFPAITDHFFHDGSMPDKYDNYVVIRINEKDEWKCISRHGDTENPEDLDVIVLAESTVKKADYAVEGSNRKSRMLTSESVDLYYFNVKTQQFYRQDKIFGEILPNVIDSDQTDYRISNYEIFAEIERNSPMKFSELESRRDESSGADGGASFIIIILFIGGAMFVLAIIGFIVYYGLIKK